MAVHAPASRGVAGRWWHGVLLAVVVPALGADAEGFASSAACLCDLEDPGAPPALLDFAREAHCWHAGRKIPPSLYASAHALYSALADSAPESSAAGQLPIASCAPGIFTALLVLLTLWEAHDAPEQLVGTVLPHALALNARYFSGVEEDIDCRGAGPSWPGRVPLMDFHRLHRRLARKAAAWQHIADFGTEPWHPREVAEARLGGRAARGLCLCLMHGEGAATLNATLASYQELSMASGHALGTLWAHTLGTHLGRTLEEGARGMHPRHMHPRHALGTRRTLGAQDWPMVAGACQDSTCEPLRNKERRSDACSSKSAARECSGSVCPECVPECSPGVCARNACPASLPRASAEFSPPSGHPQRSGGRAAPLGEPALPRLLGASGGRPAPR